MSESEHVKPGRLFHIFRWVAFKIGDFRWLGWRHFPPFQFVDVHQDEIGGLPTGLLEALASRRGGRHAVSLPPEVVGDHLDELLVGLDH